ncbi:Gfo/Idh/MocA family oxidoreductase [Cellulophaga sp. F20128]|uniref:Gfo/Idh/MocA family protein n=1 Tax=Cellulophaga sp. F20128 TaxID=2926413 RepID=UPI001FF58073|nr:Gfo/Idh/MocA family oxidoreductase [Cellulophaga sp. F20128]MCK0156134.1 Gfo/Idh/MocA family oxidoreductase [Cellulophaga sp. F20128]
MDFKRRDFLKKSSIAGAGMALLPNFLGANTFNTSSTAFGAQYMGDFVAPKLDTVRCAFIGVGARGSGHATRVASIEGTEVVAISDLYEDLANRTAKNCLEKGGGTRHQNIAIYTGGDEEWKKMLKKEKPDVVFISTPWKDHAPMAIESMKRGAHAYVEVPIAVTIEEMWQIVETSEKTQKHCMMMENVNYGREELLYLNMCRKGVIGELLHGEASYIHELRGQMNSVDRGTGSWRTPHYAHRNGNLYPTHGLGPVAQYMNLARGEDNFERIVSMSSPAKGRALYAEKNFAKDHKWNKLDYKGGDINTSIIKTTMGRTIMVQWDETSPRPYSRHNLIQGTKGTLTGFPTRIALEGGFEGATKSHHEWAQGDQLKEIFEKYEHPLYKRLGEISVKNGGHGGMDYMMSYRIIECLRKGLPMDQNVYEGCFWSAVGPLSETSVAEHGSSVAFPDFTKGAWKTTKPLAIVS